MILGMAWTRGDRSGWFASPVTSVTRSPRLRATEVVNEHFAASAVEAAPNVVRARRPASAPLPLDALDGGEMIILAVKPSALSPVFESAGWLAAMVILSVVALATGIGAMRVSPEALAQVCLGVGALRLVLAIVRWSATWYVLTNRRVVLIHGIRAPRIASMALVEIRNTCLTASPHEKLSRLSTITFIPRDDDGAMWSWKHLHNGEDVHRRVRRAIENALDLLPH